MNCPWVSPPVNGVRLMCVLEFDHKGFHCDEHHIVFWDNTHPMTMLILEDDPWSKERKEES